MSKGETPDKNRADILGDLESSLDLIVKALKANDGQSGAIASDALDITKTSGIGSFATAFAGVATAIVAALKGSSDSIIIAGFGLAAIALLALALIVMSDHRARASAYIALESSLPALIAAAAPLTPSLSQTGQADTPPGNEPAEKLLAQGPVTNDKDLQPAQKADAETSTPMTYVIPVHDQLRIKLSSTGTQLYDVIAIRVDIDPSTPWSDTSSPTPWYLVGQIDGLPPRWHQGDVGSLASAPS